MGLAAKERSPSARSSRVPKNRVRGLRPSRASRIRITSLPTYEPRWGNRFAYDGSAAGVLQAAKDPIFFRGGLNLFQYAANDPVDLVDRSGLILNYPCQYANYIEKIRSTEAGRQLLDFLENDPRIFNVYDARDPETGIPAGERGNDVYVYHLFHPPIDTDQGEKRMSTTRLLAHELGHLTGVGDTGPGRMDNINKWENPIMVPLEGYRRIRY